MADTKQVLLDARALIRYPHNWGKGAFKVVSTRAPTNGAPVYCWCAVGAVMQVTPVNMHKALVALQGAAPNLKAVVDYNDAAETTHSDILALYDRAIASC